MLVIKASWDIMGTPLAEMINHHKSIDQKIKKKFKKSKQPRNQVHE